MKIIRCRKISPGVGEGEALVSSEPVSFFGGVDPRTGVVIERRHPLYGRSIAGSVFIFPKGRGSTVGSYILYQLSRAGKAPKAIICQEAEPIVAVGAIISRIPLVDRPDSFEFEEGQWVVVDSDRREIRINQS